MSQWGERLGPPSPLISIDHRGRVLVGFATRENYSLAKREHPGLSFHVFGGLRWRGRWISPWGCQPRTTSTTVCTWVLTIKSLPVLTTLCKCFWKMNDLGKTPKIGSHSRLVLGICPGHQSPSRRTLILRTPDEPDPGTSNSTYTILDTGSLLPHVAQTCSQMAFGEKHRHRQIRILGWSRRARALRATLPVL